MANITSANSIVMIAINSLFPVPQLLQGYAADDVFDTDPLESAETLMGVDGFLSAGFVYVPVQQTYTLQADSPSIFIFDQWWLAQQQNQTIYFAQGSVQLPAINKKYAMIQGVLSNYKIAPDARKVLQPQKFRITW